MTYVVTTDFHDPGWSAEIEMAGQDLKGEADGETERTAVIHAYDSLVKQAGIYGGGTENGGAG